MCYTLGHVFEQDSWSFCCSKRQPLFETIVLLRCWVKGLQDTSLAMAYLVSNGSAVSYVFKPTSRGYIQIYFICFKLKTYKYKSEKSLSLQLKWDTPKLRGFCSPRPVGSTPNKILITLGYTNEVHHITVVQREEERSILGSYDLLTRES